VPLPGVTIEAYNKDTNLLLGKGQANREGYYNLTYMAPAPPATHTVRFMVYLDDMDGGREFIGSVGTTAAGGSIVVDNRLFAFDVNVTNPNEIAGGTPLFSTTGQFMFIEVGDVDMDDIYDKEQDASDSGKWGLTKSTSAFEEGFGFGGALELYGLFESTTSARYYQIKYTYYPDDAPTVEGYITDPLYKKNYVIAGTRIEVYRVLLGPKTVTIGSNTLTNVYEMDEFIAGKPIPGAPAGRVYSSFWTELGLRAVWNTQNTTISPNGKYELNIIAYDALGNTPSVPASPNNYYTLSLHLMNTPPTAQIHNLQYMDGTVVLSDANPCQMVILNKITPSPLDDNLQFSITASHPIPGFLKDWTLSAWRGHNEALPNIAHETTSVLNGTVQTPAGILDESCAYRFCLQVVPRITNGYTTLYVREDNWYVSIFINQVP
jgi:hypothetical protein